MDTTPTAVNATSIPMTDRTAQFSHMPGMKLSLSESIAPVEH
jgi:hypothetical protein